MLLKIENVPLKKNWKPDRWSAGPPRGWKKKQGVVSQHRMRYKEAADSATALSEDLVMYFYR